MVKELKPLSILPTILVGGLYGLGLMFSETLVGYVTGNTLESKYYLFAVPIYTCIGFLASATVPAIRKALHKILRLLVKRDLHLIHNLIILSFFFILFQGGVVINEVILEGSSFYSPFSLLADFLWFVLCLALVSGMSFFSKRILKGFGLRLFLGFFLTSLIISTLYNHIPPPHQQMPVLAVTFHIICIFLICAISMILPLVILPGRNIGFVLTLLVYSILYVLTLDSIGGGFHLSILHSKAPDGKIKSNVILIVLDTLRADHLSCYGYGLQTSPNIDRIGRIGSRLDNCFSSSNWTPPGHSSIFTGRYSISHGSHKILTSRSSGSKHVSCIPLGKDETTLAEIYKENGYQTAAVVSNRGFVSGEFGLDQGFDYWFANPPPLPVVYQIWRKISKYTGCDIPPQPSYRRAKDITQTSLRWIRQKQNEPFFLFMNYADPHVPYQPPHPYDRKFEGKIDDFRLDLDGIRQGTKKMNSKQKKHILSQYDGEIAYLDDQLGIFIKKLNDWNIFDDSIIVITSDHGEFLGERGLVDHQIGLYNPVTRVPLVIKPNLKLDRVLTENQFVSTIDIMPTLLQMTGIHIPKSVQGESLTGAITHPIIAQHYTDHVVLNWFGGSFGKDKIALIQNGYKLITTSGKIQELYDLPSDPEEKNNLIEKEIYIAELLHEKLKPWIDLVDKKTTTMEDLPELDDHSLERLKSLGY